MNTQRLLVSIGIVATSFLSHAQLNWNEVSVPTQEKLNDIQFVDNQTGFIGGDNLTLLKTVDGGETWSALTHQGLPNQGPSDHIQEIEFVDAFVGYLTIQNQMSVYKTSDGGLNWTAVPNNNTNQCFPVSIFSSAEDDLFVGGSDCFQGMTINQYQNATWTNQSTEFVTFDTQEFVRDIDFNGNLGLAAVNSEYILRSTDAGVTWDSINSNIGNGNVLTSIMIGLNDTCYAGYNQNGGGFGILYSNDAGQTWQEDLNSATFYYPAYYGGTINANGKAYITAVPSNSPEGLIFERNAGQWMLVPVDQSVYAMDSYGDDVTWAVGDSGYVVVNQDLSSLSIFDQNEPFDALEVFPNPTNTVLKWSCADCTTMGMEIIDLKGNVVKHNEAYLQESVDVSDLPSGVYVISVNSNKGTIRKRFIKE
ncbi:MAG: hypothetical protein Crog4KO_14200 [Crocinitomicaceae bacterium]